MPRTLIDRFICDNDAITADVPITVPAQAGLNLPDGWSRVSITAFADGKGATKDALVCSEKCASAFTKQALAAPEPAAAPTPLPIGAP